MSTIRFACAALAVSASIAVQPPRAHGDVVLDWNVIALKTTAAAPFNPPLETRNVAIVHAAIFDAVNSITRDFRPYAVLYRAPSWASPEAAAAAAAHHALLELYPQQQPMLDAEYTKSLGEIPDGPAKISGVAVGERVAQRILTIRAAEDDGNPDTAADPAWTPLLVTPPFPDYIAGHTTYAGAAQSVLQYVFGRDPDVPLSLTSATAPGVTVTYTTFKEIADGVVDARVWGGIHWRTSSVRGRQVGQEVGRYAVRHFLKPCF